MAIIGAIIFILFAFLVMGIVDPAVASPVEAAPEEEVVDEVLEEQVDDILDDEVLEEEATPPPEEAPAVVPHPPELLDEAHAHLFTAEEIAQYATPEQLRTAVNAAKRVGQAVYNANQKPSAPEQPQAEPDSLAVLDNAEKYDQDYWKPLKGALQSEFQKLRDELKVAKDTVAKIEKSHATSQQQTQHSRLMALAAQIDPAMPAQIDKQKYAELVGVMGGLFSANKNLTEKQLFDKAIKSVVDIPVPKDPDAERKANWDKAALAKPSARAAAKNTEEKVQEILNGIRKAKPNGESGRRK